MENKLARFFRSTGALRFLLPIGIILIVMGVIMTSFSGVKGETDGTVTKVNEYTETDSDNIEETRYDVEFTYTVGGKDYSGVFSGYADPMNLGDKVKVYYDPADPEKISNVKNPMVLALVMIGVGAAAIIGGILLTIRAVKKNRKLDKQIEEASGGTDIRNVVPIPKEQLTEYYVSFDGKTLRPGYIVEDRDRNVVFAAPMTKNSLVGNRVFTFEDKRLGTSTEHQVGHVTTQSYNDEMFSASSYFKFDGKNIWDLLHDRGIRIKTEILSQFPKTAYTVAKYGKFFATIETAGKYVHEEDAAEHKINIPYGSYYYRVWTNDQDMELLFLTVFAISETEQLVVE